jgi:UDP-N-acetylmuramate dehydrogenase
MDEVAHALEGRVTGRVARSESLSRYTTYRLGGPAEIYVEPDGPDDIDALGDVLGRHQVPVLIVGRGSNLVISDAGWPGVAIHLGASFSFVEEAEGGLRAGAATALPLLANWAARRGLAGMEFTIAIPGSVGGAVRMNAGAHGREISDSLVAARVYDLATSSMSERDPEGLQLAYRHSNLTAESLVVDAVFGLRSTDPAVVKERMESYRRHRAETQPGAVQNAGSVFRNPPDDHAGRLVEASGLKGFRIGGARVSELHANFFIAGEGSTAQDVYDLVAEVRRRVLADHGTDLIPEIRFVGAFVDHPEGVDAR